MTHLTSVNIYIYIYLAFQCFNGCEAFRHNLCTISINICTMPINYVIRQNFQRIFLFGDVSFRKFLLHKFVFCCMA